MALSDRLKAAKPKLVMTLPNSPGATAVAEPPPVPKPEPPLTALADLFDAKEAKDKRLLPQRPRDAQHEHDLWVEWKTRAKSHGAWSQQRWAKVCEKTAVDERIGKGTSYIAEHPLDPNRETWLAKLADLRQQSHDLGIAISTYDDVILDEADHLGAVEEAIKKSANVTLPSYICGTCQKLVTSLKDHSAECRQGWRTLIERYAEATKTPLKELPVEFLE